jgi:hypothetical protein
VVAPDVDATSVETANEKLVNEFCRDYNTHAKKQ